MLCSFVSGYQHFGGMFCPIFCFEGSRVKIVPGCYVAKLYGRWSLRLRRVSGSGVQLGLTGMLSRKNDKMVHPVIVRYKASEDVQDWTASVHEPYLDVLCQSAHTALCFVRIWAFCDSADGSKKKPKQLEQQYVTY